MRDLGLLILRLTVGSLVMAHGSQKLFGWFGGPGLKGTHGFVEKLGMAPGHIWGTLAALGEFNGGLLTALGFLNPLGPLNIAGAMSVAIRRAHWGKPIWASQGGPELPLTNLAVAVALALGGSGRYSLDGLLGTRLARPLRIVAWLATAATVGVAVRRPELAQKAVEKVAKVTPGVAVTGTPNNPELVVENRTTTEHQPSQ